MSGSIGGKITAWQRALQELHLANIKASECRDDFPSEMLRAELERRLEQIQKELQYLKFAS